MVEPRAPTILIVEDEPGIAQLQRRQLERAGYVTRSAGTGEEALAALAKGHFDLLLLDYRLPGELMGLSLLERIKTAGHDLPIIVVTAYSDEGTAINALRAGVRDFIPKTANYLEYLPAAVERVLRQVRTERRLAESEARLAAIINTAKDAVIVVEADRRVTLFNAAAERMFGCSAAEAAGQPLTHFIPDEYVAVPPPKDDDDDLFSAPYEPTSESYTFILRSGKQGVRASGERFPLETSVSRVEVGGRRFYTLLVRDITERVRAEQELRAREERFRSLSACSPVGIFLTDANGQCSYSNPRFDSIVGRTGGQSAAECASRALLPEERKQVVADWLATVARGEEYSRELRLRPIPDLMRWVSVKAVPILASEGGPAGSLAPAAGHAGYVGTVEDITERVQAERQLRAQATLLDKATDAILVRDLGGRIRFWNAGAERLYGWSAAEAVGRDANELIEGLPSPALEEALKAVRLRGEWVGELRQATRDGREVVVTSRWTLVRESGVKEEEAGAGSSLTPEEVVLVINTDVTEQKKLESQLQRTQRLESIGVLAGGIAHDLNNVLTPVLMAADLLLMRETDPESRSMLSMLRASTERGAELVKQILTFARGTEGQRQVLYLPPLFREIGKLLTQTFPKSIVLEVDVPRDLWFAAADTTQLHQVLMNLCVNARDAMPSGGQLRLSGRNERLTDAQITDLSLHRPGEGIAFAVHGEAKPGAYVILAVADTGSGILPDLLDRIFVPFFTTKDIGMGTGLGLSTTLAIVKNSGGFLTVRSEVGRGSLFEAWFPGLEQPPSAASEEAREPPPTARGELILVVDDEASIREVARAILEASGYRVLTAANGAEGMTLYAQHQDEVRAVLTDMVMPIMDGAALTTALSQLDPSVRIITASGYAGPEAPGTLPGVRAMLAKPYSVENLLKTVREVIDL